MKEASQTQSLKELAGDVGKPSRAKTLASVRMSSGGYLAIAAVMTFVALICLRTHRDLAALIIIFTTWSAVPALVLTDRLTFDGLRLRRTGPGRFVSRILFHRAFDIAVADIESVEVASLRTLRRGGNVRYRYRVDIAAGESSLTFSSGRRFRHMVQELLPRIAEHKLDARACELRDHLVDLKVVRAEAARLGIASSSLLENTREAERRIEKHRREGSSGPAEQDLERAALLRRCANDLRMAGCLKQSAEAFRRALLIAPQNGRMIYEYARLLKSQASAFSNGRLLGRACAALKLASMRAPNEARLLERIGETFLEYCDPVRAAKSFRRALEIDENSYRAQVGLAEVALGEGKLAHVIHHYNDAVRIAPDKAAARLARREADYYSRLNTDEDYLAAELRRMNWLEGAGRVQRVTARVSFSALLIALVGSSIDQVVAGLAWALASSSIIAWSGALITRKFMTTRRRVARDA
ncbi:MAG: tetratricopeptide repeat protein [Pyrinomonadaceae bacterium]